jgi:hypothetical protein
LNKYVEAIKNSKGREGTKWIKIIT